MNNTVSTCYNINNCRYLKMPAAPKQIGTKDKNAGKTVNISNPVIMSLGGLAVLGIAGFFIKSRISKKAAVELNDNKADILKIIRLKNLIKNEIVTGREPLVKKLNEDVNALEFGLKYKSTGELSAIVRDIELKNSKQKETLLKHKAEQTKVIREKITVLSKDPEWLELRNLRKNFIKTFKNSTDSEKKEIAAKKIVILNDLLINKVYPEEVKPFEQLYRIPSSKMLEFVKKEFSSLKDYEIAFKEAQTIKTSYSIPVRNKNFTHMRRLRLSDIFPNEVSAYIECNKEIEVMDFEVNSLKRILSQYHSELKALAANIRNSENVEALRAELAKNKK